MQHEIRIHFEVLISLGMIPSAFLAVPQTRHCIRKSCKNEGGPFPGPLGDPRSNPFFNVLGLHFSRGSDRYLFPFVCPFVNRLYFCGWCQMSLSSIDFTSVAGAICPFRQSASHLCLLHMSISMQDVPFVDRLYLFSFCTCPFRQTTLPL